MIKLLTGYKTWAPTNQEGHWQSWGKVWPSASSPGLLVPSLLPCWLYIPSLEFQAATLTRTLKPFAPIPGPPAPGLGVGSHCLDPQFLVWVYSTAWPQCQISRGLHWRLSPPGPPNFILYLPQGCTSTLGCRTWTSQLALGMQAPSLPPSTLPTPTHLSNEISTSSSLSPPKI